MARQADDYIADLRSFVASQRSGGPVMPQPPAPQQQKQDKSSALVAALGGAFKTALAARAAAKSAAVQAAEQQQAHASMQQATRMAQQSPMGRWIASGPPEGRGPMPGQAQQAPTGFGAAQLEVPQLAGPQFGAAPDLGAGLLQAPGYLTPPQGLPPGFDPALAAQTAVPAGPMVQAPPNMGYPVMSPEEMALLGAMAYGPQGPGAGMGR